MDGAFRARYRRRSARGYQPDSRDVAASSAVHRGTGELGRRRPEGRARAFAATSQMSLPWRSRVYAYALTERNPQVSAIAHFVLSIYNRVVRLLRLPASLSGGRAPPLSTRDMQVAPHRLRRATWRACGVGRHVPVASEGRPPAVDGGWTLHRAAQTSGILHSIQRNTPRGRP
jgi:hypothetical protein